MSKAVQPEGGQDRGLAFSVNFADEKAGVSIVFQSLAPQEAPLSELNAILDKITDASTRQMKRLEIPRLKAMIAMKTRNYERSYEDFARIEAKMAADADEQRAKGKHNPSAANNLLQDRQNADTALKRWREEIIIATEELAEANRIVNGGSNADLPANRNARVSGD